MQKLYKATYLSPSEYDKTILISVKSQHVHIWCDIPSSVYCVRGDINSKGTTEWLYANQKHDEYYFYLVSLYRSHIQISIVSQGFSRSQGISIRSQIQARAIIQLPLIHLYTVLSFAVLHMFL